MDRRIGLFASLILSVLLPAAGQEESVRWSPAPGRYASALVRVDLSAGAFAEYRFSEQGDGIWRPLTEPLDLSAFPLEERAYSIQLRIVRGTVQTMAEARYVIDRLPPAAPTAFPPPGSYEGPVDLRLSAEAGAVVFYSVEAQDRPTAGFRAYDPANPPRIDRPTNGTRTWTLSAYAVDSSGNPGPIMTARYPVEPKRAGAAVPGAPDSGAPTSGGVSTDSKSVRPGPALDFRVERQAPGVIGLVIPAGDADRYFAAVNPPDPVDLRYYTELPVAGGVASMKLSAPSGWTGPLRVRLAKYADDALNLAPEPAEIAFSYEDPGQPPPLPPEPRTLYPPGTRTVLLSWGPFPFRIEVSVGEDPFAPYVAPLSVAVPEGSTGFIVRYRSVSPGGAVSAAQTLTLSPPRRTDFPEISGLPAIGITNKGVRPRAPRGSVVRYESSTDGFPAPVKNSSPLLDENAAFAGEEGRELTYNLRMKAFSDLSPGASESDELFVSFVVDRSPPALPKLSAGSLEGEAEEDRVIAFEPGEGTLRFAVAEKGSGTELVFKPYEGPVLLAGSGDRPIAYEVYAYAVDDAGNKSEIVGPISVRIDRASVYVAAWGSDSARGGPRNPLATLSAGVDAAVRAGKRFVRVQGDAKLGGPLRPAAPVEILGACDEAWEPVPGAYSSVDVSDQTGPLISVNYTELTLRNCSIAAEVGRDFVFAEVENGILAMDTVDIRFSGLGEFVLVRARDSEVRFEDSAISIAGALYARVVESRGGQTRVRGLRIRAETAIGYFLAFSFEGGTADLSRLRSESRSANGFTLVRGVGSRVQVRDSYIRAAGSGFSEAFHFEGGSIGVYLTSADLSCEGPLAFASLSGAGGDILHSTVSLGSEAAVFLDLKKSRIRLGNSLILDSVGDGTLIRADEALPRGAIVRNAVSGFRAYVLGPSPAATLDALNRIAAPPDGLNFAEDFDRSKRAGYAGLPVLPTTSAGRNGAYPLEIPLPEPLPDGILKNVGAFEGFP